MMNKFYSSLIINTSKYPEVHQVFRPRYNREFFKRLTKNVAQLEEIIKKRSIKLNCDYNLNNLKGDSKRLIELTDRLSKINPENEIEFENIKNELELIEDKVMPFAVNVPNRVGKQVPEKDFLVEEIKSNFQKKQNLVKILSHTKLSYINNCYSKSVVGPNSHYYFGIGAKLQHAIADFFTSELEKHGFINTSGLCLVKSALVEAANSYDSKSYMNDPCRVLTHKDDLTTLHLVETSKESLISFLPTLEHRSSNNPLRIMATGAGYGSGNSWFDSDNKRVTQFQTLHTLSQAPSIEQYSIKEYCIVRDLIWESYKKLQLPARLIHCSVENMLSNEYDAHRIELWLPSKADWIQVARVSHYLDYITVRMGLKRGHIIDSSVYNGQVLVAAIIENKQTSSGRFIIPLALREHMVHLSKEESSGYFEEPDTSKANHLDSQQIASKVLNNYEQRRYLVKKSYAFAHSHKAKRKLNRNLRVIQFGPVFVLLACYTIVDWTEVWIVYMPEWFKRITYTYVYKAYKDFFNYLALPKGYPRPVVPSYDEMAETYFNKTTYERRKEEYNKKYRRYNTEKKDNE